MGTSIRSIELKVGDEMFTVEPGAFFLRKSSMTHITWGTTHSYDAVFVYDVFEKQNKNSNVDHACYFKIGWWHRTGTTGRLDSGLFVRDRSGRVDGRLKTCISYLAIKPAEWSVQGKNMVEFTTDTQDLGLVIQSGKTVREIIAEAFAKQHKKVQTNLERAQKKLEVYDSVEVLIEEL